jgi:hypothetical protein
VEDGPILVVDIRTVPVFPDYSEAPFFSLYLQLAFFTAAHPGTQHPLHLESGAHESLHPPLKIVT